MTFLFLYILNAALTECFVEILIGTWVKYSHIKLGKIPPLSPTATGRRNLGYPLGYSCKKMYWKESEVRNTHKAVIFNEKQGKIEQHVSTRTRQLSGTLIAELGTCLEQCLDTFWNPVDPLPPVTIHVCLKFDHFLSDSPPPSTGCHKCMAPYWSVKTFEYLPPKKHRKSQREYQ